MWCRRSPLAGPAPVRASECRPSGLEGTIYAVALPLRGLLCHAKSVLLRNHLQLEEPAARLSNCVVREGDNSAVISPIELPNIAVRPFPEALRCHFACYDCVTENDLPPLARCKVTIPFTPGSVYAQLSKPTANPAETVPAAEDTDCTKKLAQEQCMSQPSTLPALCQEYEHGMCTPTEIQRRKIQTLKAQLKHLQARLLVREGRAAACSTADGEHAEIISQRAAVSRLLNALSARGQALQVTACPVPQSNNDESHNSGSRTDAAEAPQTFAQRTAKLQRLLPGAPIKARKAEALQAALDTAAVLKAEAHCAGQQRPGLTAHRDSLIAYQKMAQDATPNPYWEDPEGLVEAALQRRAAERQARSASAPSAAQSAQPQAEMQAAQESAGYSEPAAQPAAEQRASAPYQKVAQDAARNSYWVDPEGLVQAALQRRDAERQARSAGALAAPKSAQPQPEKQAAQGSVPCSEPAVQPAAEQHSPAPAAEAGSFTFPELQESSCTISWGGSSGKDWRTLVAYG